MRKPLWWPAPLVAAAVIGLAATTVALPSGQPAAASRWVDTWTAMPQLTEPGNMPPPPFTQPNLVLANSTVRQTVHVTTGGRQLRLQLSNAFGGTDLPVTAVSVALPADGKAGVSAIKPDTSRTVTFAGQPSVTIPVGALAVSDPVDLPLAPQANLTVTLYLATGQASSNITSHPGSRTTSYLVAGNHLADADLSGATPVDHWYFISAVEVASDPHAAGVAIVGDSITDGRGSTTNGNDRWPDELSARLQGSGVSVLNQAAGGNRVLHDGLGPNAVGRFDRDVLAQDGINWAIVFEGVNDIGTATADPTTQHQVVQNLMVAYQQMVTRAHSHGIRVYGVTITPFGGNSYDDPTGYREAARQSFNTWIRTSHAFDAVVDFDRVARDPAHPTQLLPAYDTGDHLHLNPAGYRALGQAVPLGLFR
ncbi:SGNH/GDSL hydrolase family protein [Kutzneria chonburiensis]|uniref:SGNH/GDSL hydrolase family protein n=1 Tax=Kutzneria chonburiensis TaxID=1483604 RepID=A0ABV6MN64_9PSEU|nr:SGNH/GDSL hydrolase family protein [Kutzneria chonburiensis]